MTIRKQKEIRKAEAIDTAVDVASRYGIKDYDIIDYLLIPLCLINPTYFERDERGVLTPAARERQEAAAERVRQQGDLRESINRHFSHA